MSTRPFWNLPEPVELEIASPGLQWAQLWDALGMGQFFNRIDYCLSKLAFG